VREAPALFFYPTSDGLVKSPSAALRGNFVVAALARLRGVRPDAPTITIETIVPVTFKGIIKSGEA